MIQQKTLGRHLYLYNPLRADGLVFTLINLEAIVLESGNTM